ncbi:MAG: YdcF family protein [Lysobacter sp.]
MEAVVWMLSPLSWLLLALLFAWLGLGLRDRGRWLVRVSAGVAVVAVLAMTPMTANALIGWLETQPPAAKSCVSSPPQVAVVLAGGVDTVPIDPSDLSALGITSRRRVERAVAWWHERPDRSLILSGGPHIGDGVSTGALMADYARRLGVATTALHVEGTSNSTWENARALADLQPLLPRRVALVTSAMHMPRARYAMTRAGFDVCAIAADPRRIPFGLPGYLIPRSSALDKTEAALHEIVGLAYYRWLHAQSRSRSK